MVCPDFCFAGVETDDHTMSRPCNMGQAAHMHDFNRRLHSLRNTLAVRAELLASWKARAKSPVSTAIGYQGRMAERGAPLAGRQPRWIRAQLAQLPKHERGRVSAAEAPKLAQMKG